MFLLLIIRISQPSGSNASTYQTVPEKYFQWPSVESTVYTLKIPDRYLIGTNNAERIQNASQCHTYTI